MTAHPLLLAAGLPADTARAVSDAVSPWGPLAVYEDVVEALMRLHQATALLVVLPADRADTIAAAERIRDTRPDTVVVLVASHGISDRLLAHWTGDRRAHLALRAPITRTKLRQALAPLLPESQEPDPEALAEEAALARAVAEQAGQEAEEATREAARVQRVADGIAASLDEARRDAVNRQHQISALEEAKEEALATLEARSTMLTALQAELTSARADAGHLAQDLARAEAALEEARLDAQTARDQQITDITWFMGQLKRARE
jgi:hypothetical protein